MGDVRPLAGASICLVTVNYAPETTGIGPYATAFAQTMRDAGAAVHVIAGIPYYPAWRPDRAYRGRLRWDERDADGIEITRFRHVVPRNAHLAGRLQLEVSFGMLALPAVRQCHAHAVIAVTPALAGLATAVAGARGRPVGAIVQDLAGNAAGQSGTTGPRTGSVIAAAEYALLRRVDRVGVITPRFGEVLVKHGLPAASITDVANFTHIATVTASTGQARARLGWQTDRYLVVHSGNMGRKQSLDTVVAAAEIADREQLDVDFVLLGHGNQRQALEARAAGVRNIRFVDPLDATEYPYALAAADALLLCERRGVLEMSLPSKLTSYVTAKRPIIAAVEPGGITHDVVSRHRAALVTAPGDPRALLAAIQRVRADPALRDRLCAGAVQLGNEYDQATARQRYLAFAQQVLDTTPARHAAMKAMPQCG